VQAVFPASPVIFQETLPDYVEYEGAGCNDAEVVHADTGPCLTVAESIAQFGNDTFAGTVDRMGSQLPRSPDWKFTLDLDYWYP
jgi:hypothetical protein